MLNEIHLGDCKDVIPKLPDNSIRACITSPPYAMQRKLYNSISEKDYPQWTVNWMETLKPKMVFDGSVLIVIRAHVCKGQVSDYVLRTRLAVREAGWIECEELIWFKPDAPPLGSILRPRRVWESILWFSLTHKPFIDLRACGNQKSKKLGGFSGSSRFGQGGDSPIHLGQSDAFHEGTSRCTDAFTAHISDISRGVLHPAMYPTSLADQLIKTFSEENNVVLDPFSGSGTTCIVAKQLGRQFIGCDLSEDYVKLSRERLGKM